MRQILSKCVAVALAMGVVVAASSAADAHHRKWHRAWQRADYLIYDYSYSPIYGYSLYGNCYLVEHFVPYRPYLERVCPGR